MTVREIDEPEAEDDGRRGLRRLVVIALLVVLVLAGFGGWAVWRYSTRIIQDWEARGYVAAPSASAVVLDGEYTEKLWYWADSVKISGVVRNDIALFVNTAEVSGQIDGDLEFFGRRLLVHPGTEIGGKLIVQSAQHVTVPESLRAKTGGTAATFKIVPDAPSTTPASDD